MIAGIREQFDVLRISEDFVINIEVKKDYPKDGIEGVKNQLVRHQYILGLLNIEVLTFTYIIEHSILYKYDSYLKKLQETTFPELAGLIPDDFIEENLLKNINLSELIISPYTEPQRFMDHHYFLTEEQSKVSNDILDSSYNKIGLIGGPGTGKSLILVDLAKKYMRQGKSVLLVFCASMFEAPFIASIINIEIIEIKELKNRSLDDYDIILVDEAQRLRAEQLEQLIKLKESLVIFSTDHQQTLHDAEKSLYIENKLKENSDVHIEILKHKIRTDRDLSSFIQKFLNLRAKGVQPYDYDKVDVVYFSSEASANQYIKNKVENDHYTSIELTEYVTKSTHSLKRQNVFSESKSTHQVIGREYDNVLVPLDHHFKYSSEAKLTSDYNEYYPYHEDSCIFEALTRVKEKLLIVVIDNPSLYQTIQEIMTWKDDTLYNQSH